MTKESGSKTLELLEQKDAYPHEYMNSFKRFGEEKLPDEQCFYSSLKDGTTSDSGEKLDGHISDKDYLMCKKIRNKFNLKNRDDYHDHYSKKDVLLLADVFEKLIEKIVNTDIYLFIEKGLRGGIYYIAKRYSEVNNKYMKYYDPTKSSKYISYIAMNNLYGWAKSRCLPCGING